MAPESHRLFSESRFGSLPGENAAKVVSLVLDTLISGCPGKEQKDANT